MTSKRRQEGSHSKITSRFRIDPPTPLSFGGHQEGRAIEQLLKDQPAKEEFVSARVRRATELFEHLEMWLVHRHRCILLPAVLPEHHPAKPGTPLPSEGPLAIRRPQVL